MSEDFVDLKGCKTPEAYNKCAYPAPYPEIKVARENPYYGKLLLEDYAGRAGELTAINQYIYHHFVLEPEYEEVAELLSCIALVEMHHMEILADTILKLGVDPRQRTIAPNEVEIYWDAGFVYYGTALCDMITANIAGEWAAISNYRKHQQMINDLYVKKILERIILDEIYHVQLFSQVTEKYCKPNIKSSN